MVFWANSDYNRSWTRCLYARYPHAEIVAIDRNYLNGWIKVTYRNNKQLWKGKHLALTIALKKER